MIDRAFQPFQAVKIGDVVLSCEFDSKIWYRRSIGCLPVQDVVVEIGDEVLSCEFDTNQEAAILSVISAI